MFSNLKVPLWVNLPVAVCRDNRVTIARIADSSLNVIIIRRSAIINSDCFALQGMPNNRYVEATISFFI